MTIPSVTISNEQVSQSGLQATAAAAAMFRFEQSDVTAEAVLADVPAGAEVTRGMVLVSAKPGGTGLVSQVAVVRSTEVPTNTLTGTFDRVAFVVDFQRMRTVSAIVCAGITIEAVIPWLGTQFATYEDKINSSAGSSLTFSEVQTERLLLIIRATESSSDPNPPAPSLAEFVQLTNVTLPVPPSDLELLVNGTRVWFRPGPVRPEVTPGVSRLDTDFFKIQVDLTAEIAAAVKAGPNVRVTLKSSIPGQLGVEPDIAFRQIHPVVFPEGDTRTLVTDAEGLATVAFPVPSLVNNWQILELRMIASGEVPPIRVKPASGPEITELDEVALGLDAEHTIVVRLPAIDLDAFGTLSGIRLPIYTGPDGAEVAGILHADADGAPGEVIPGPSLGPITVEKHERGAGVAPSYLSLLLPRPRKLEKQSPLWVAVQVSRGTLIWPATILAGTDPPRNALQHGLPNGPFKPMPAIQRMGANGLRVKNTEPTRLSGVVRIVGESAVDRPIPALTAWIAGGNIAVTLTPNASGVALVVPVNPPNGLRGNIAGVVSQNTIQLQVEAATAATFSFRAVEVVYRQGA